MAKDKKSCPAYNPDICKYNYSTYCAFIRKDGKCKKPTLRKARKG